MANSTVEGSANGTGEDEQGRRTTPVQSLCLEQLLVGVSKFNYLPNKVLSQSVCLEAIRDIAVSVS